MIPHPEVPPGETVETLEGHDQQLDLDVVRCMALRAPVLTDPTNARAQTMFSMLDEIVMHPAVNRVVLLASVLKVASARDPGCHAMLARSYLPRQFRHEVDRRKAGANATVLVAPSLAASTAAPAPAGPPAPGQAEARAHV